MRLVSDCKSIRVSGHRLAAAVVPKSCGPQTPLRTLGGADRDRTDDLRLAKPALSQLSYSPDASRGVGRMVGQGRVELPTSRLSGVRSNHLSYWPGSRAARSTLRRARSLETESYARALGPLDD